MRRLGEQDPGPSSSRCAGVSVPVGESHRTLQVHSGAFCSPVNGPAELALCHSVLVLAVPGNRLRLSISQFPREDPECTAHLSARPGCVVPVLGQVAVAGVRLGFRPRSGAQQRPSPPCHRLPDSFAPRPLGSTGGCTWLPGSPCVTLAGG